jgi:hypothetical protein
MVKGMNTHKNNGREIDCREIIILEKDKHRQNGGFESFFAMAIRAENAMKSKKI